MNDYWHIPRASLASSSAASTASSSNRSNKSNSQTPTVAQRTLQQHHQRQHAKNTGKERELVGSSRHHTRVGHAKRMSNTRRDSELSATSAATTAAAAAAVLAAAAASSAQTTAAVASKRGSRSSQGSSGSNNSTRSAASGSLLLTAANLERFAEIHKKQQQHNNLCMENVPKVHNGNAASYTSNLALALQQQHHNGNNNNNTNSNNDAVITMDPNLDFIKTKDLDTVSIASSMHFTMVNGEGGPPKKPKRGLCDRGRQVTVLIVSMSMIFLLLIMGMVYALEMRAREMPQS